MTDDLTFMNSVQPIWRVREKRTRRRLFQALVRGIIFSGDSGCQPFYGSARVEAAFMGIKVTPLFESAYGGLADDEKASDENVAEYWESLVPAVARAVARWWDNARCECGPGCVHNDLEKEFIDLFICAWNYDESDPKLDDAS